MLCISEQDIIAAVKPEEILEAVDTALRLYETGGFLMPDRMHLHHEENVLLVMPCFSKEKFSTKLVTVYPGNVHKNLPVVIGTVVLNDGETGQPLALLNGTVLTALRTGAVGAVGIRYTTPPGLETLGIVGAGKQGLQQVLFAAKVRKLSEVCVYDTDPRKSASLIGELSARLGGITFHQAGSVEELLRCSGAIITATTSKQPVLPDKKELLAGKHFVGIGSFRPGMQELPEALFQLLKRVLVDNRYAVKETGDLVIPLKNGWIKEQQVSTLGKWIAAGEKILPGETTLFKSVGMACFDLMVSDIIYRRAVEKGLGKEITF